MQFIVGVNVRAHIVEGTNSPTVCNFLFLLRIHFKILLSGPSRVTGPIQRLFSVLRSFVGTQNHSDAALRTADTAGSNWVILLVFTACPNCGLLEFDYV